MYPPLHAGRRYESSAAEEVGWSLVEQQRRRRWRGEESDGFARVSLLGHAGAAAGGDDDDVADCDDGTDGGGGDGPTAPRCHTTGSQGTLTRSEVRPSDPA